MSKNGLGELPTACAMHSGQDGDSAGGGGEPSQRRGWPRRGQTYLGPMSDSSRSCTLITCVSEPKSSLSVMRAIGPEVGTTPAMNSQPQVPWLDERAPRSHSQGETARQYRVLRSSRLTHG